MGRGLRRTGMARCKVPSHIPELLVSLRDRCVRLWLSRSMRLTFFTALLHKVQRGSRTLALTFERQVRMQAPCMAQACISQKIAPKVMNTQWRTKMECMQVTAQCFFAECCWAAC